MHFHCFYFFQTSSGRAQFVEQSQFYKLYPTAAGLNDCWQLTAQQWVASGGRHFSIFNVDSKAYLPADSVRKQKCACALHGCWWDLWRVAYNPPVVVAPSSGGSAPSIGFKSRVSTKLSATAGRQVHGKQQWYSRRKAGGIALFAHGRMLSVVKTAGLYYRL